MIVCNGYFINNCSFYTKSLDDRSTVQNSGVMVEAESMQFSTAKDNNPLLGTMPYYGIIEEIWEVVYSKFHVPVFKCKWVDNNTGVHIDDSGHVLVDFSKVGYKDEPFIMAQHATQVFYIKDPSNERLSIVIHEKNQQLDADNLNVQEIPSYTSQIPMIDEIDVDDVQATRHDNNEGIFI